MVKKSMPPSMRVLFEEQSYAPESWCSQHQRPNVLHGLFLTRNDQTKNGNCHSSV
jgi:hypothetical protein